MRRSHGCGMHAAQHGVGRARTTGSLLAARQSGGRKVKAMRHKCYAALRKGCGCTRNEVRPTIGDLVGLITMPILGKHDENEYLKTTPSTELATTADALRRSKCHVLPAAQSQQRHDPLGNTHILYLIGRWESSDIEGNHCQRARRLAWQAMFTHDTIPCRSSVHGRGDCSMYTWRFRVAPTPFDANIRTSRTLLPPCLP